MLNLSVNEVSMKEVIVQPIMVEQEIQFMTDLYNNHKELFVNFDSELFIQMIKELDQELWDMNRAKFFEEMDEKLSKVFTDEAIEKYLSNVSLTFDDSERDYGKVNELRYDRKDYKRSGMFSAILSKIYK